MASAMANRLKPVTGLVFHELYMWHHAGSLGNLSKHIQPTQHWEHPETKRRFHNLLSASGLLDHLKVVRPLPAAREDIIRVHTEEYVDRIKAMSGDLSNGLHTAGDACTFSAGGYDIAMLSAGGALALTESVLSGNCTNGYALVRPPGHHAEANEGMGFCIFNNVAIAVKHAMKHHNLSRVAIIDFDVHHGNGTQHIFEDDDSVLFISIHQDSNYPLDSGKVEEQGMGKGQGFTINAPLPPGSGSGAYRAVFDRVVLPALDVFKPELIMVSCGFDGAYMDPLASMMLSSDDFRFFTQRLMEIADKHCGGRLVYLHEGGYSELYVPFCGLAVLEQLSGIKTAVSDPFLAEVTAWGYQSLQDHQDSVIKRAEEVVALLKSKCTQ